MRNCFQQSSSLLIEIFLLINNSLNIITTVVGMIIINWEHASYKGLILYIFIIILSIINELFLILILLWRKKLFKNGYNSKVVNFSFIGLVFSISIIVIFLISEIFIKFNFNNKDYPCKNYKRVSLSFFRLLGTVNEESNQEDICETLDRNYYTKTVDKIEYIILYINSTVVEILSLVNTCLWTNFLKRVKQGIEDTIVQKNIPYINNCNNRETNYPYQNNVIIQGGIGPRIKQINIMQNNYKGVFVKRYPNKINHIKSLKIKRPSKINQDYNIETNNKNNISIKDKSEEILYIKPITVNSLNNFVSKKTIGK